MNVSRRELLSMCGATVVASFSTLTGCIGGGGGDERSVPNAAFNSSYEEVEDSEGILRITHDGGEKVEASKLLIRGSGFTPVEQADQTERGIWQGETSTTGMVVEGNALGLGVVPDYDITIIYRAERAGIPVESFQG